MAELPPPPDNFKSTGLDIRSHVSPVTVTAASYTVTQYALAQALFMAGTAAQTVTIPANADLPLDIGTVVTVIQQQANATTVAGASGVTVTPVSGLSSLVTKGNPSIGQVIKVGTNSWVAYGGFGG